MKKANNRIYEEKKEKREMAKVKKENGKKE